MYGVAIVLAVTIAAVSAQQNDIFSDALSNVRLFLVIPPRETTTDTLYLEWRPLVSTETYFNYMVIYEEAHKACMMDVQAIPMDAGQMSYNVTSLDAQTSYVVLVIAFGQDGKAVGSNVVSIRTRLLEPPSGVDYRFVNSTCIEVLWREPSQTRDNAQDVQVHINVFKLKVMECPELPMIVVPFSAGSSIINGLNSSEAYIVTVKSVSARFPNTTSMPYSLSINMPGFAGTVTSDYDALLEIMTYFKVDLRPFNWGNGLPCAKDNVWYGVTCEQGFVSSVNLSGTDDNFRTHRLGGSISPAFAKIPTLKVINLSFQDLEGYIPDIFDSLGSLENFDVAGNKLKGPIPHSLVKVQSLLLLSVADNELTGPIPDLSALINLEKLYLYRNFLSGEIPPSIVKLNNIRRFNIGTNRLHGGIPSFNSTDLPVLEFFGVEMNSLFVDVFPEQFCTFPFLEKLQLASVRVRNGHLPDCIAEIDSLVSIDFSEMGLAGDVPPGLYDKQDMEFLDLEDNLLTGNLSFVCGWSGLLALDVSSNKFEGTIPDCLQNMPRLQGFYASNNRLTGTIPRWMYRLPTIRNIEFEGNLLEVDLADLEFAPDENCSLWHLRLGSLFTVQHALPASILGTCRDLVSLELDSLGISGGFPVLTTQKLAEIDLSNNNFTGEIPRIGDFHQLVRADISQNRLSGSLEPFCQAAYLSILKVSGNMFTDLPDCFANISTLLTLDAAENEFTELPPFIAFSTTLISVDLSFNRITYPFPYFSSQSSIQYLYLNNNPFNTVIGNVLQRLRPIPEILQLVLSSCGLNGNIMNQDLTKRVFIENSFVRESGIVFFDLVSMFQNLTLLNLANNGITGQLPAFSYFPNVGTLELSNNEMSGTISEDYSAVQLLKLYGNYFLDPLQRLPSFLRIDFATITLNSTANFSCPEIVAKAQSSSVSIDPYYLGYSHCTCNANFYGEAPVCRPCPTGTICNGTGVLAVKAGYWLPEADVERAKASKALEADPIPCYPDGPGTTACNPESSANFTCKVGTAGRLCSVCDNVNGTQYFKEGRSCYSCMVWGWLDLRVLLPLGYSIMIIGMTAYMLWLPPRTPPSAYFRVGASFMQIVGYLRESDILWPPATGSILEAEQSASISITAIECAVQNNDYLLRFYFTLSLPVLAILHASIVFLGGCAVGFYRYRGMKEKCAEHRRIVAGRCFRLVVYFWNLVYIGLVRSSLNVFSCYTPGNKSSDPPYMTWDPQLVCPFSEPSKNATMIAMSFVAIVIYVVGIPVVFLFVVQTKKTVREGHLWGPAYCYLAGSYRAGFYWWDFLFFLRKFLVVTIVILAPPGSIVMPVGVYMVILLFLVIQLAYKPFQSAGVNIMDVMGLFATLFIYFLGILLLQPGIDDHFRTVVDVFMTLANFGVLAIFAIGLGYETLEDLAEEGIRWSKRVKYFFDLHLFRMWVSLRIINRKDPTYGRRDGDMFKVTSKQAFIQATTRAKGLSRSTPLAATAEPLRDYGDSVWEKQHPQGVDVVELSSMEFALGVRSSTRTLRDKSLALRGDVKKPKAKRLDAPAKDSNKARKRSESGEDLLDRAESDVSPSPRPEVDDKKDSSAIINPMYARLHRRTTQLADGQPDSAEGSVGEGRMKKARSFRRSLAEVAHALFS